MYYQVGASKVTICSPQTLMLWYWYDEGATVFVHPPVSWATHGTPDKDWRLMDLDS